MSPIMRRRVVGRSLIGAAATTAVVVGTAGAVAGHQQQKAAQKQAAAQQQAAQQQQTGELQANQADLAQQPVAPLQQPASVPAIGPDLLVQLQQLAQMHAAGILTDEEFTAAKQKLLVV
jgi:hypothetical protein